MVRRDASQGEDTTSTERWWRTSSPQEAILGQLAVLVDEANALVTLLKAVPDEIIHGRPFDGVPSIRELLGGLVDLDRGVRRTNLSRFLSEAEGDLESGDVEPARQEDATDVSEILTTLRDSREELIEIARKVARTAWDRTRRLQGEEVTPIEYLNQVVQHDALVLRQVAERIHESLPAGLPGFTAH